MNRAANGGYGVNNFLNRDFSFDSITESIDPQLVMIMLGQNDQVFGYTETQYATLLQQLVTRIRTDLPNSETCSSPPTITATQVSYRSSRPTLT